MATAVIYARQSFGKNDESVSIEIQIANCENWCKRNGVDVIGVYADRNTSSECYPDCESGRANALVDRGYQRWKQDQRTKGRKEYKVALGHCFDMIEAQKPTYIVVNTANRLGRSATSSNLYNYITAFLMDHRCSIVDVSANHVTDFSDKLLMAFQAVKDALDFQGLAEKRRSAMQSVDRRINSFTKWSNAYGVVMDKGVVRFDPVVSEAIKYIYVAMSEGSSYSAILDVLNTKYRHLARGKQWYVSNIRLILGNLTYCGYMRDRNGVIDRAVNIPDPIISYTLYTMANNAALSKKANGAKYCAKGNHRFLPLSGYLKCHCGRRLTFFLDRGKIGYHCVNGKDHTCAIYIDDDVLLTIQQIFVLSCLDSRRSLAFAKASNEHVGDLEAKLQRLKETFRAKFNMIQSDSDYDMVKDDIERIKTEIADTQKEITEAKAMTESERAVYQDALERDFHMIMERELLPELDYVRLLQATIDEIDVTDKQIEVRTRRGVTIPIPRVKGNHHSKRLMKIDLLCDTEDGTLDGICHYQIHIGDGDEITGGRLIYDSEEISVWQH